MPPSSYGRRTLDDALPHIWQVTFNGSVLQLSEEEHADLFWATRGGGGGMGVLTSLTFRVVQAPSPTVFTRFDVRWALDPLTIPAMLVRFQRFLQADPVLFGGQNSPCADTRSNPRSAVSHPLMRPPT